MKNVFSQSTSFFHTLNTGGKRLKTSALLFLMLLASTWVVAQTSTWTGAVSANWNAANNWNPMGVPGATSDVVIPGTANKPVISTGTNVTIKSLKLQSNGQLTIQAGSVLNLDGPGATALILFSNCLMDNYGTINIGMGNSAGFSSNGMALSGTFTNHAGAVINIDKCNGSGIYQLDSHVVNAGKINIGFSAGNLKFGLIVQTGTAQFDNDPGGEIKINYTNDGGISVDYGFFQNFGNIDMGNTGPVGLRGLYMSGWFLNKEGATLKINRTTNIGVLINLYGYLKNNGTVHIGSSNSVGQEGIRNEDGEFYNVAGVVTIDRVADCGFYQNSYIGTLNFALIKIGANVSGGVNGIVNNKGTFENKAGGEIQVDRVSNAAVVIQDMLVNDGTLRLGANNSIGVTGIYNNAKFLNNASGSVTIDNFLTYGIFNEKSMTYTGDVENHGDIQIGDLASGIYSIYNKSKFENGVTGELVLDGFIEAGIHQASQTAMVNNGTIKIGQKDGFIGEYGINVVSGGFTNMPDGMAFIYKATKAGIENNTAMTLTNYGQMSSGGSQVAGSLALKNKGVFFNYNCARMFLNGALLNTGDINNSGHFMVLTSQPLTSTGNFNNLGVLDYQYNSFLPAQAVYNLGIISKPFMVNCTTASPVLTISPINSLAISSVWTNIVGEPAGTYNTATNTLQVTDPHFLFAYVVSDLNASCAFDVFIAANYSDAVPPTVQCKNTTLALQQSTTYVSEAAITQSVNDNCGILFTKVTPNGFDCTHLGANTVKLEVRDAAGNTASCNAVVTVVDATAPQITCKNVNKTLNAAGNASVAMNEVFQSGSDNCSATTLVSVTPSAFTCANVGANTVTLKVSDASGNTATCQATVTVTDGVAPTMVCKSATIALNAVGQATISTANINNGSFDNCSIVTLELSQTQFGCANVGVNNVVLTGSDASGNKAQCFATVTVTDPVAPVAKCKNATMNLGADGTVAVSTAALNNGSSDNCSFTLSTTPATLNCGNMGVSTVVLKATDTAGNTSTCTALVTVKDVTAPAAKCKNATVFLNDVGQGTLTTAMVNNNSTDACGITSMTLSKTQFNCSEIPGSAQAITMTLKDASNNTATCLAYVTVKDNLAPTAVCENTTVSLGANGSVTVYPSQLAAGSFDNCSVWSYSPTAKVYTSAHLGVNNLTITVKDWSNNAATCVSQVTVVPFNNAGGNNADRSEGVAEATLPVATEVELFPNPADHLVHIRFEVPEDTNVALRLYDLNGRLVFQAHINAVTGENIYDLELQEIPAGVYLTDLQGDAIQARKRLVVQR